MTITVTARVIDCKTREGMLGLRVEAWTRGQVYPEPAGSANRDAEGMFPLELDKRVFGRILAR